MIQEFEEESYTEMLVDMQPLLDTPFLQNTTKEGINEILDKAIETIISLGDLTRGGDKVHMDKAMETLDKLVEVGIQVRDSDKLYMALCQNFYTLMQ